MKSFKKSWEDKRREKVLSHGNSSESDNSVIVLCFSYKFISNDTWGTIVTDVLVKRNGARNEEIKESAIVNLASQATYPASRDTIGNQCDRYYLSRIVGYKSASWE